MKEDLRVQITCFYSQVSEHEDDLTNQPKDIHVKALLCREEMVILTLQRLSLNYTLTPTLSSYLSTQQYPPRRDGYFNLAKVISVAAELHSHSYSEFLLLLYS